MDRDTITALTIAIRIYRQLKAMGYYDMPIKWNITADAMKARGLMDQISAEYKSFATDGTEHLADVKGLRTQLGEMKTDLYAAANVMGNGSASGSNQSQGEKQTITSADIGKVSPEVIQGEQSAAPESQTQAPVAPTPETKPAPTASPVPPAVGVASAMFHQH